MTNSDPTSRSLRLLLELGRGGMGVVYLALHQGPGGFSKLKVVKRLRPDLSSEPAAVEMFLEEGRLSARLHHPNVVQTNEVGFDGKHYFLEMEYLEGQTFEAFTKRARATATTRATGHDRAVSVWILAQALAGLHYAHELTDHQGTPLRVVHRDVSPHNVFVTYDGEVKVLDFGIAKAADSQHETQTGVLKGKVTYMAPEQVARKALDRRADVFAAGVILWQILSGERLWKDLDDFEIFLKLRSEDIPSPSSVNDDVPEALEGACMRALARNADARTPTAAEMKRELEAWLESSGVRVGPKEVAAQMEELFARDRTEIKSEIDQRIRTTPANESVVGVPMLRMPAERGTADGLITANTVPGEGTRVRQQRQIRGLRTIAMGAMGIAVVASVAASVATLRNRHARALAAADAGAFAMEACTENRMCAKGEICRKDERKCVALATDRCVVLADEAEIADDRTIWIGAMFPKSGPQAADTGIPETNAVDLARRDFREATRGIPSPRPGTAPRPFAVIACDDSADEEVSARHLADDLGVPAVIGFKSSTEAIELARDVFIPRGVFVATTNPSAQVTQVPQPTDGPRLVWRTTAASTLNAVPPAHLVTDLIEGRLRKAGLVSESSPMRVAVVRPKSQYGLSMAEALTRDLSFNGRSALANGANFIQLVYDASASDASTPTEAVSELVEFAPHVILYAGDAALAQTVFAPVEHSWRAKDHRPYWISVTDIAGKDLFAFIGRDADLRRRFLGVSLPSNVPANAQLAMHYSSEFSKLTVNETPAAAYDAAYLIAYATYVAGDDVTGRTIARGIARLVPPGTRINVGPTHIFEAIESLRRGGNIDLVGANTRLDFDLATGESSVDWVIQCVGIDARGFANDAIESGLTFEATTGRLTGELRCP